MDLVIGGALGTWTLYWLWHYARGVRTYWRGSKRADQFERWLRMARDQLTVEHPYRVAGPGDSELVALLRAAEADQSALEACGFTAITDLVIDFGSVRGMMRVLVDQPGTTFATLGVGSERSTIVTLGLFTLTNDEQFATVRSSQPALARPPFAHRQQLPANLPVATIVSQHHAFARVDGTRAFVRIANRDALLAELARFRAKIVSWRDSHAPDELLDADLRAALGEELYASSGTRWKRRLRARLPVARMRRPS